MSERVEGTGPDSNGDPADFRVHVATQAIRLFAENGYEATTVEQIAAAAGVSRRTFFRQFRSKEDVIFADHESLLEQAAEFLSGATEDPWVAVCEAAGWCSIGSARTGSSRCGATGGPAGAGAPRPGNRHRLPLRAPVHRLPAWRRPAAKPLDVVGFAASVTAATTICCER